MALLYDEVSRVIKTDPNQPDWKQREAEPVMEGCYIAKWDNGDIEPAWFVKYGSKGVFQRKCGTEEGREGWDGNVGRVVGWSFITVPV